MFERLGNLSRTRLLFQTCRQSSQGHRGHGLRPSLQNQLSTRSLLYSARLYSENKNPDPQEKPSVSQVLQETDAQSNSLLAPVHLPENPDGILKENHPAARLLANSSIVVQRQLELMNVMM